MFSSMLRAQFGELGLRTWTGRVAGSPCFELARRWVMVSVRGRDCNRAHRHNCLGSALENGYKALQLAPLDENRDDDKFKYEDIIC